MTRQPPQDLSVIAAIYASWSRIETKRRAQSEDLKAIFLEAKHDGFNTKALRKVFAEHYRLENQTNDQRVEAESNDADFELYLSALARVRESDAVHDGLAEPASGDDGRLANSKSAHEHEPAIGSDPSEHVAAVAGSHPASQAVEVPGQDASTAPISIGAPRGVEGGDANVASLPANISAEHAVIAAGKSIPHKGVVRA